MKKLRVALVGAGFISSARHIPAYRRLADKVELVGISDVNENQAAAAATKAGIGAVYNDPSALIAETGPDLVDICTPPATHCRLADTALRQGANVLIEKPMALNVEDCDRIIDAARQARRQVCVAHTGLFYEPFLRARRLVESGKLGPFRGLRIVISTPTDYMTSSPEHWAHKLPGGAIGETGPHPVYMSLAFLGSVGMVTVDGLKIMPEYPWSQFEDYRINLLGERGISSISVNYATGQWLVWVEIACADGTIFADLHGRSVFVLKRSQLKAVGIGMSLLRQCTQIIGDATATAVKTMLRRGLSTHDHLIEAYVDSLLCGGSSPVSGVEGREAVKVMAMIAAELDRMRLSDGALAKHNDHRPGIEIAASPGT
jgi:predicted dehydrogenase